MNDKIELARKFVCHTGKNIFLTGKAGTGKTTFLKNIRQECPKRMIVTAPTGVAAINAGGVTLHSFFQLPFGPYLPNLSDTGNRINFNRFWKEKINIIRSLDLLVIDEISMVRADLLDAVSDVLCRYRKNNKPFGAVQLLLIGDMQQLAPVAKEDEWALLKDHYTSPYFFASKAFMECDYHAIELTHVYRQEDQNFIDALNAIRENRLDQKTFNLLNSRYLPDFSPSDQDGYITLTTHNRLAQEINMGKLDGIRHRSHIYTADIKGDFPAYSYPTDENLTLKLGAQVMFVKNDSSAAKEYFNGKIGKITDISSEGITVIDQDGNEIEVHREIWENVQYTIEKESKEIKEEVIGSFVQYPLKPAWAITIHKSQGLTFEHVVIDAAAAFSPGQVYVALSRCKTLDGLVLRSPINARNLMPDNRIEQFNREVENSQPNQEQLADAQKGYFTEKICELFDFEELQKSYQFFVSVLYKYLHDLYPALCTQFAKFRTDFNDNVTEIGRRFQQQLQYLTGLSHDSTNDAIIDGRIRKGAVYFMEHIGKHLTAIEETSGYEIDSKEARQAVKNYMDELHKGFLTKNNVLTACRNGFEMTAYLRAKAKSAIDDTVADFFPKAEAAPKKKADIPSDIQNQALFDALRQWRNNKAKESGTAAFVILHQKALIGIANTAPIHEKELLQVPGIGKKKVRDYGAEIIEIVRTFAANFQSKNGKCGSSISSDPFS